MWYTNVTWHKQYNKYIKKKKKKKKKKGEEEINWGLES